jgi:hypothetical protein
MIEDKEAPKTTDLGYIIFSDANLKEKFKLKEIKFRIKEQFKEN